MVDTNVVFRAILNTNSRIAHTLTEFQRSVVFCAPAFLLVELDKHRAKLARLLNIGTDDVPELQHLVTKNIHLINEFQISTQNWKAAEDMTKHVDSDDVAFVALALELDSPRWTGDKKLQKQITGVEVLTTEQVLTRLSG